MPRTSKITPSQRQDWLQRSEKGDGIEKIARDVVRDVRTVREHLEKARSERDFKTAQLDQLRDALRAHQQDMLGLLQLLKLTVYTPDLDPKDITGLDVGFEDFWRPSDLDRNREVIVRNVPALPGFAGDGRQNALTYESAPSIGVILISNASGPQRIKITAEDSRLWRALREHTGKDPLWRHFANWRNALLEELQGRAALNRAIREKVEKVFALRVSWRPAPQTPWLAPSLVWWIRVRLTQLALGNYVPHVEEEIRDTPRDGWETQSRQTLTEYLPDMKKGKEQLQNTMTAMAGRAEVEAAAQNYQDLQEKTKRVYDALEELLLIHHIAGRCGLCKKLGGQ